MTDPTAATWWADHQELTRATTDDFPSDEQPLSEQLLTLLDDVEATFTVTGAETPGWEDPHVDPGADGESRDSLEEEYSRCLDPGKYRILWARAEAWTRVLTARGWADAAEVDGSDDSDQLDWAIPPHADRYRATVLRPHRPGALPLVLARTAPDDAAGSIDISGSDALILGLVVGIGDPVVAVSTVPDCGCDACDSGSRGLLEDLDRTLLSIVDGSFEVAHTPQGRSMRSSFGAESGSGVDDPDVTLTLTAGPWAEDWTPRPLSPAIEPGDSAWADEMMDQGRRALLLDTLIDAFPPPVAARLHRLRPGRSGTLTSYFYAPLSGPVTAPLDALEHPPAGYRRDHRSTVVIGMDFEGAATALRSGELHRRAGLQISAAETPFEEGTEVRLLLGRRPFQLTAPCRVLWVIDEPDRQGFAYGTLPGHPESGIEQFTVTRTASGLVRFHLDVVSRPATWYARLGAPVARLVQERITRRYLRALSTRAT